MHTFLINETWRGSLYHVIHYPDGETFALRFGLWREDPERGGEAAAPVFGVIIAWR